MIKNNNTVTCNIKGMNMIVNTDNGAVVGVTEKELNDYTNMNEKSIMENKDFYRFLSENEFLFRDSSQIKAHEVKTAYVHVTDRCNLHCLGCYSDGESRNNIKDLSTEEIKHIFSELKKAGTSTVVISGGEPLFRKDIAEIAKYAKEECGVKDLTLITNGTVDNPEVFKELSKYLDTIAVSIDTFCESCPSYLRDEGIFNRIMKSVEHMKEQNLTVSILPTLHHKNIDHIIDYIDLSVKLGTKISFSIFTTDNRNIFDGYRLNDDDLRQISTHFMTYGISIDDIPLNNTLEGKNKCGSGCGQISVSASGELYPCHMLMEEEFKMGNLLEEDIFTIMERSSKSNHVCKLRVDDIEECKDCEFKYLCGGGCRARTYLKERSLFKPDPFCKMYKEFYEDLLSNMSAKAGA